MIKITCDDIELSIMFKFNYVQNLIVPNITNQSGLVAFETDMLILTKSGYATGFEIKTSLSDLKAEFNKDQHRKFNETSYSGKPGFERYYGKFKYFYYAVPEDLKDKALELIPEFCGLYCLRKFKEDGVTKKTFYEVKQAKKLFERQWTIQERYEVARLGTMRLYGLKYAIADLIMQENYRREDEKEKEKIFF